MSFRTLDLNLLRVFDVVMVERNVTRAAARLAMTQPAVSNALRRLREALGEDLLVPYSNGVAPTPHALAIWPAVREALAGLREVFEPQGFDPANDARSFTLTMADATAAVLLPPLIDAIRHEGAAIDLRIEPLTTRDPQPQLERGVADAAIGFFPDVARALAASAGGGETQLDPLYHCGYVCAMRSTHALAAPGALTLDAYCAARHARVSFAGRPHGFVDEALSRLGRRRRVAALVPFFATALQLVGRSDLLCVFPYSYLKVSAAAAELAVRPLPFEMTVIDVGLLWHRRHERDPAHAWLRQTLARVAREEGSAAAAGRPQWRAPRLRTGSSAAPSAAPTPART